MSEPLPHSLNPAVAVQQRRLAWQMVGVVLLPILAWTLSAGMAGPGLSAFIVLYGLTALILMTLMLKWFRLPLKDLRAVPRLEDGGALAFLTLGLLWAAMWVIPAWQLWADEEPEAPASSYQTVRGEVPAEAFEYRQGRGRRAYLNPRVCTNI